MKITRRQFIGHTAIVFPAAISACSRRHHALIQSHEFEDQVYAALKGAFSTVIEANTDQRFYTFGLFTDDSLQFLQPTANTEEALTETVKRYRETVDPKYGSISTRAGMRWSYGDWGFFPIAGGNWFDEINETLRLVCDDDFDHDLEPLWNAVLNAFKRIERESFFGTGAARSKITLVLVGDLPEDIVNTWVSELNPPGVVDQYGNKNYEELSDELDANGGQQDGDDQSPTRSAVDG